MPRPLSMTVSARLSRALAGRGFFGVLAIGLAPAVAQTAPATTSAPTTTTAPAVPAIDPATPIGTVQIWLRAMDGVQPEQVRQVLLATTPDEQHLVDVLSDLAAAIARLRAAAIDQFGNKVERLTGDHGARFASMRQQVQANRARVIVDPTTTIELTQVDGRWRIPVAQVTPRGGAADVPALVAKLRVMVDSVNRVTDDVANDRFHTADEVAQAMQEEVVRSAVRQDQPPGTTLPATTTRAAAPTSRP